MLTKSCWTVAMCPILDQETARSATVRLVSFGIPDFSRQNPGSGLTARFRTTR